MLKPLLNSRSRSVHKVIAWFAVGLMLVGVSPMASHARDPLRQPFHHESIWNTPIGDEAEYVHARIQKATARGMTVDEDLIVLTPGAPMLDIYRNNAGWNREKDRCIIEGELLFSAPIPPDFIVSPDTWDGLTPNSGLAVLMPDRRTIKQTQPFARCVEEYGTSRYLFADEDLYGPGYYGAHGGLRRTQKRAGKSWRELSRSQPVARMLAIKAASN